MFPPNKSSAPPPKPPLPAQPLTQNDGTDACQELEGAQELAGTRSYTHDQSRLVDAVVEINRKNDAIMHAVPTINSRASTSQLSTTPTSEGRPLSPPPSLFDSRIQTPLTSTDQIHTRQRDMASAPQLSITPTSEGRPLPPPPSLFDPRTQTPLTRIAQIHTRQRDMASAPQLSPMSSSPRVRHTHTQATQDNSKKRKASTQATPATVSLPTTNNSPPGDALRRPLGPPRSIPQAKAKLNSPEAEARLAKTHKGLSEVAVTRMESKQSQQQGHIILYSEDTSREINILNDLFDRDRVLENHIARQQTQATEDAKKPSASANTMASALHSNRRLEAQAQAAQSQASASLPQDRAGSFAASVGGQELAEMNIATEAALEAGKKWAEDEAKNKSPHKKE